MVKHADSLVPIPINLSEARWNPLNISTNFTQTDITPKQLADNLLNGLGIVPGTVGGLIKTGVDEIANITGNGIKQLFKTSFTYPYSCCYHCSSHCLFLLHLSTSL